MKKNIKYITGCVEILTVISAVLLIICLLGGVYFVEFTKADKKEVCQTWEAVWNKREATREELQFLTDQGVKLQDRYIIVASARLPQDAKDHTYLLTNIVYSDVWFFVGESSFDTDELRYVFYPESETQYAKTGYSARRTIPLYDSDRQRYLTILQVADSQENFILYKDITYGDKYALLWDYISNNYVTFVSNIVLLVLSVVSVIIAMAACVVTRKKTPLLYMVIGILNLALWSVTNAFTTELVIRNWHLMYDMLYLSDFIMPVAFMLYLNEVQEYRYYRVYLICEIIYVPLIVVGIVLYITNICNLHDFFMKLIGIYLVQILVILVMILVDIFKKNTKKYQYVMIGFAMVAFCGVVQVLSYMMNSMQTKIPYLSIGIILLLLMCIVETAKEILNSILEKTAALSANKAKSDVLARMSHEIRTPINAILGMNEMILRTTQEAQSRQYAQDVRRATDTLLEIVNEILDFSKIDSGKMELVPSEYQLAALLQDVVNMFTLRAQDKGLEFHTDIAPNLPIGLYGDGTKLRQILSNLLSNAVKYTNEGWIELRVTGEVCDDKVTLHFSIKDTGIGIKPENMSRLFGEFERIEENQNRGVEGTGLGISITMRFLQMMDSSLKVSSIYAEGSEFSFDLVQELRNAEPIGDLREKWDKKCQEHDGRQSFTAPQASILVVDDNRMNRNVFCSLLQDKQIHIDQAECGVDCIRMVQQKHYDLIFLDHMMPQMDGVETFHALRQMSDSKCADTPVIALTANVVNGARDFYLAEGFDDFLAKPFKAAQLEEMLLQRLSKELIRYDIEHTETEEKEEITFPDICGIDWAYAIVHFKDKEAIFRALEEFYMSITYEAEKLKGFYEKLAGECNDREENFRQYCIQVHGMKSMANLIGATSLGAFAWELEHAADERKADVILRSTLDFLEEWCAYKERLTVLFEQQEEKAPLDVEAVTGYLEELKIALEELDVDKMDFLIKNIDKYVFSGNIRGDIEHLKALVIDLDDKEGIPLIDRILQMLDEEQR